jgi:hypothetical protein
MPLSLAGHVGSSSPRKRGSRLIAGFPWPVWIPAFAGMTFAPSLFALNLMTLGLGRGRCKQNDCASETLARQVISKHDTRPQTGMTVSRNQNGRSEEHPSAPRITLRQLPKPRRNSWPFARRHCILHLDVY